MCVNGLTSSDPWVRPWKPGKETASVPGAWEGGWGSDARSWTRKGAKRLAYPTSPLALWLLVALGSWVVWLWSL